MALGFTLCLSHGSLAVAAQSPRSERILFLGDSITDGGTYILFVGQALEKMAGHTPPILINAGIGGDTAAGMQARLERDVFSRHPDRVFLSCGVNDRVPVSEFRDSVESIAKTLNDHQIGLTLMTPSIPGGSQPEMESRRAGYIEALKAVSAQFHLKIADVNALMQRSRSQGKILIGEDNIHPNYEGSRVMARAVLDALGYERVAVPPILVPKIVEGVIKTWQVRSCPKGASELDVESVKSLTPDDSWKSLTLPEAVSNKEWWTEANGAWWQEQERLRGFAFALDKIVGPGESFQAVATLQERGPRRVWFSVGAGLKTVWLNGTQIYKNTGWTGWHNGKEQIEAELHAGANQVVIESGSNFFLSVVGQR